MVSLGPQLQGTVLSFSQFAGWSVVTTNALGEGHFQVPSAVGRTQLLAGCFVEATSRFSSCRHLALIHLCE